MVFATLQTQCFPKFITYLYIPFILTYPSELFFYWMELFLQTTFQEIKLCFTILSPYIIVYFCSQDYFLKYYFLKKKKQRKLSFIFMYNSDFFDESFLSSYPFLSLQYKSVDCIHLLLGRHTNFTLINTMLEYCGFFYHSFFCDYP